MKNSFVKKDRKLKPLLGSRGSTSLTVCLGLGLHGLISWGRNGLQSRSPAAKNSHEDLSEICHGPSDDSEKWSQIRPNLLVVCKHHFICLEEKEAP